MSQKFPRTFLAANWDWFNKQTGVGKLHQDWRSNTQLLHNIFHRIYEVDFLLGTNTAIEVKATQKISRNDFKGLKYLKEEGVFQNLILVSQDPVSTLTDNIRTLYWKTFLSDLWDDKFV